MPRRLDWSAKQKTFSCGCCWDPRSKSTRSAFNQNWRGRWEHEYESDLDGVDREYIMADERARLGELNEAPMQFTQAPWGTLTYIPNWGFI